jgi:hypothetical protein
MRFERLRGVLALLGNGVVDPEPDTYGHHSETSHRGNFEGASCREDGLSTTTNLRATL